MTSNGAIALTRAAISANADDVLHYLSAILLGGLILNAALGWWWADPLAALLMVPIIVRKNIEAIRGRTACADCCP